MRAARHADTLTTCRGCGHAVLRVWAEAYHVDLEPQQLPITTPLDGYEHHPTYGWHHVWYGVGNTRRGHPVHARHKCTTREGEPA